MKKNNYLLAIIAFVAVCFTQVIISCDDDDDSTVTTISIDKTSTEKLDVGDMVNATITISADKINSFKYYKVVDEVKSGAVDVLANLTKDGKTYTYNFAYQVQEFDDLHTLGFEFEVTDNKEIAYTAGLVVNMNISVQSSLVKYDWKVTASEWLGSDVLSANDAAYTYRFNEDGTYEVDLSADYADSYHHFCYWVYKETPNNGDTLAVLRLIRRLISGDTGEDEYYDYRIVSASEREMTMYWDIAAWGLMDIKNTFTSQPKGAFQPYGTEEMATEVESIEALNCSAIDDGLLTIQ